MQRLKMHPVRLSVEDVNFSSDELRRAQSLSVTPAAPGEKGRAPKSYSLLDVDWVEVGEAH